MLITSPGELRERSTADPGVGILPLRGSKLVHSSHADTISRFLRDKFVSEIHIINTVVDLKIMLMGEDKTLLLPLPGRA
jgi:hypothetical protein